MFGDPHFITDAMFNDENNLYLLGKQTFFSHLLNQIRNC